jgi:hypothetical protein
MEGTYACHGWGYLDDFPAEEPRDHDWENLEEVDEDEEAQKQSRVLCAKVGQDGFSQVERQNNKAFDRCAAQDQASLQSLLEWRDYSRRIQTRLARHLGQPGPRKT